MRTRTMLSMLLAASVPVVACEGKRSTVAAPSTSAATAPQATTALPANLRHQRIPSASMLPTFHPGDSIAVADMGPGEKPRRGQIIVFRMPETPSNKFVKRVAAVEGDTLEVKSGHPWLNGWEVPSCLVGTYKYQDVDERAHHEGEIFVEYLEDQRYLVFFERNVTAQDYSGPFVAKPGEVWVLGDNRMNSHDSRMWFGGQGGGVPRDLVLGHVLEEPLALPSDADASLKPALDRCLASRPASTPPASK